MAKVVPFRRPAKRDDPYRLAELQEEAGPRRQLRIHILLFSAIALVMYAAAMLAVPGETGEKLWFVWLILAVALSKLALANGVFFGVTRADRQTQSNLESAKSARPRSRSARGGPPRPRLRAAPRDPRPTRR